MIYGYVRVSTEKQTTETQIYEIDKWCKSHNLKVNDYVYETISGTKSQRERALGKLLAKFKPGDVVICSEVSRLSRSMVGIFDVLSVIVKSQVGLHTLKENYDYKHEATSKFMFATYGFVAETEHALIVYRTREGLASKKRMGVKLGRRKGSLGKVLKLDRSYEKVLKWLNKGVPKTTIADKLKVDVSTLYSYIERRLIISEDGKYTMCSYFYDNVLPLVQQEREAIEGLEELVRKHTTDYDEAAELGITSLELFSMRTGNNISF